MTVAAVDEALDRLLGKEDPAYAQLWSSLSRNQKKAVKAVMDTGGRGLASAAVARRFETVLRALPRKLAAREVEVGRNGRQLSPDQGEGGTGRYLQ